MHQTSAMRLDCSDIEPQIIGDHLSGRPSMIASSTCRSRRVSDATRAAASTSSACLSGATAGAATTSHSFRRFAIAKSWARTTSKASPLYSVKSDTCKAVAIGLLAIKVLR